jgi:lipopolysaccharide/colanic/teichoic acid biosynthesis glycosyltransferase
MYKHFFKRFFDFWIALVALICISPILLVVTIWLHFANKGAGAFFFQERPGKNAKLFKVIKFKTMTDERDSEGKLLPDAVRLTKIGKFVRSTSIDELPQLLNVLKGDISLIGPRAAIPREVELYPQEAFDRFLVPQGLSGEWQANGRSDTSFENMIKMDLDYINNKCGFWHDVALIFKTVIVVIKGSGAE